MRYILLTSIILSLGAALSGSHSSTQVRVAPPAQEDTRALQRMTVDELVSNAGLYHDQLVILTSYLRHSDEKDQPYHIYRLREPGHNQSLRVSYPRGGVSELRRLVGNRVEVIGTFWDLTRLSYETVRLDAVGQPRSCWEAIDPRVRIYPAGLIRCDLRYDYNSYFVGVQTAYVLEDEPLEDEPEHKEPEPEPELPSTALVDLRELVARPLDYVDQRIGVIGKYRGNNLYGDLDFDTKKTPRDFVIKVADAAIWVTGKRAPGLNADKRRDTGRWVKVIGTAWMDESDVYVKAEWIGIVTEPSDASLEPVVVEEEAPLGSVGPPPEVLFVLPIDGEENIPLDTEFMIQFSKDMDPECFGGYVELSYSDGDLQPKLTLHYDVAKRTLVIRPETRLLPQKTVHLVLRRGIRDVDGIPLPPRLLSRRASMKRNEDSTLATFTFTTQSES